MEQQDIHSESWLDKPLSSLIPRWNLETLVIILILVLAVVSRFYEVDLRVMSHDEVNHVVPAYDLYQGRMYRYDPVTHGPLQFHLLAFSYFLLGDSDFSARVPAVLFSIATVAVAMLAYRRYLGRSGAVIAGILFLISPFMLFYGRYTRNEVFQGLWIILMIYAALRYLEKGDRFSLLMMTTVVAFEFTDKATSYIFVAQMMIFLALVFMWDITRREWPDPSRKKWFLGLMLAALLIFGALLSMRALEALGNPMPVDGAPEAELTPAPAQANQPLEIVLFALTALAGLGGLFMLVSSLGWVRVRAERSFNLLMLLGVLALPMLGAFPVRMLGWNPLDTSTQGMIRTGVLVALCGGLSILIGLWWNRKIYLQAMAIFFTIFGVFYTTFFTNVEGFFTGLVGALGYWVSQQDVQRGSQPLYYYALIQLPIYEYLASLGTLLATYLGVRHGKLYTLACGQPPALQPEVTQGSVDPLEEPAEGETLDQPVPVLALFLFWSLTGLIAFSLAGERMPWLTLQIATPMLLAAAWAIGYLVDSTDWKGLFNQRGVISLLLSPVFFASLAGFLGSLLGDKPPFQGNTLEQLSATAGFLVSGLAAVLSGGAILYLLNNWSGQKIFRLALLVFFGLMGVLTARTAFMAAYVNYDTALEYLVYAHAARGPKDALEQVEEISRRMTGGKEIKVAYDNDALYPYWWYFRDYPNHQWYTDKPTRELRDAPIIIAGESTMNKLEPIVKDDYVVFNYMRLWWPNQDYWNLTWERVWNAIKDPQMRTAIYRIWMYRDYRQYAQLTNNDTLRLETWQPGSFMRMYVRKDVAAMMWNYGSVPQAAAPEEEDPYLKKLVVLNPDRVVGSAGPDAGQLQAPRGLALAGDGTLYVADSRNHRIQHLKEDGTLLQQWGGFADATQANANAPGGTFNEPWDVAIGPDGSVYVSDTWNHRVQKFTMDGKFVTMWGHFGQAETPDAFWGPRGLAVDGEGRVYVADTGNKRIAVFDANGEFITQFGSTGMEAGQFDEPVGLALDEQGNVYVADTWNQRVQVFSADWETRVFSPIFSWDINGWYGQSLDNKPFLDVDREGRVYVSDPEGYRVLVFNTSGEFLVGWGDYSSETDGIGLASGVAADNQGGVWLSDAGNSRLLHFKP